MRLLAAFSVLVALGIGALVLSTTAFRPPPAADRLAGVALTVTGHATDDLDNGRHRLRLTVDIASLHDLDVCLGFTLDEPFAGRRMRPVTADCVKPRTGHHTTSLVFDTLTDDDVRFPAHTLVWGIPGGRCGAAVRAIL